MNINEYIEKYSTVDVDKNTGLVTVTMEVPPRKVIHYTYQECEASHRVKVKTGDIQEYLVNSGLDILSARIDDSIDNNVKLTARWEYNTTPAVKKKKKNNRKDNLKEIIEDIS